MAPHDYNAPRKTNDSPIAQARLKRGITQKQLAEALNITQQQVQMWETGARRPKMEPLMKIAEVLGIDWHKLYRPH